MPEPTFLPALDAAVRAGEHALVVGNLHDLFLMPFDGEHRPIPLTEAIALHFERAPEPTPTLRFSLGGGLEVVGLPGELRSSTPPAHLPTGDDPAEVLPRLTHVLRSTRCVLILSYADFYLPAQDGPLHRDHAFAVQTVTEWGLDTDIRRRGSLVVVVSPEGRVHPLIGRLGSGFRTVTIGLPDCADRALMLDQIRANARHGHPFADLDPTLDPGRVAYDTGGLRLVDLYRLSRERRAEGRLIDQASITARKATAIAEQAGGILEVHDTTVDPAHVSGLEHVTGFVERLHAGGSLPRGLLLVGPPGTGKSMVVRLVAASLSLPLVSLRNIHEQWVGASERNLERVLMILEALAPVVVWIDEIDQYIGGQRNTGPSADGGTSERVLARLMEFMGDHSAQRGIVWIGTSNRPDVLDTAIEDRFPVTIPLIHPSVEEIADALPALAAQQHRRLAEDTNLRVAAEELGAFAPSMRTLVQLLERAGAAADERTGERGSAISQADLSEAFIDVRDRADPDEKEFLALTAIDKATYRSLLPWTVRQDWTPPAYLSDLLSPTSGDGWCLDESRLTERLELLATWRAERRWRR